jgi:DNA-binding NarL/FixJ family response regulator
LEKTTESYEKTPNAKSKTIRILLADDHTAIREAMADLLKTKDFFEVVAQAENGRKAVEMADKKRPDVVLMDVSMPEMDGIEATRLIKKKAPNVCVIGLSMHENDATRDRMISAGASSYFSKATPISKLVEFIREAQKNHS